MDLRKMWHAPAGWDALQVPIRSHSSIVVFESSVVFWLFLLASPVGEKQVLSLPTVKVCLLLSFCSIGCCFLHLEFLLLGVNLLDKFTPFITMSCPFKISDHISGSESCIIYLCTQLLQLSFIWCL